MEGMNLEWTAGGVLLLIVCIIFKQLQVRGGFQTLVFAFTFAWSTFVALHFWETSLGCIESLLPLTLSDGQSALAAFWLAFVVAALPGMLLVKFWLGSYKTTFPTIIDNTILGLGSLVVAFTASCLVLLSLAPFAPPPSDTRTGQAYGMLRTLPGRAYIHLASFTEDEEVATQRRHRLRAMIGRLAGG